MDLAIAEIILASIEDNPWWVILISTGGVTLASIFYLFNFARFSIMLRSHHVVVYYSQAVVFRSYFIRCFIDRFCTLPSCRW